jgi:hypothetical protein
MKKVMLVLVMMVAGMMASAQTETDTAAIPHEKPHVNIKVNKVYDEDGNVIRYDSTYVWSYSNSTGDVTLNINPDSLFRQFKPWFKQQLNMNDPFTDEFFNDSTMYLDFFNNQHFFDQWQDELFNLQKEVRKMDSLKQLFFNKYLEQEQIKSSEQGKKQ